MKIGVTGSRGRVGSWLVSQCGCEPLDCDITSPESIKAALASLKPDVIVNCAAWTNVDGAEDPANNDRVMAINLRGVANLRRASDGYMVHLSSGFIFNGKGGPYSESPPDHAWNPVNVYGWSKLGGEAAAEMRNWTLVVRVADLYGVGPKTDFVRSIRDALALGLPKPLPTSLQKTPTYIPHLAEGLLAAISRNLTGTLHVAGATTMSTLEWGKMIAEHFGFDPALIVKGPVQGAALRPRRAGLATGKARRLGIPIYSAKQGLEALSGWEATHG